MLLRKKKSKGDLPRLYSLSSKDDEKMEPRRSKHHTRSDLSMRCALTKGSSMIPNVEQEEEASSFARSITYDRMNILSTAMFWGRQDLTVHGV